MKTKVTIESSQPITRSGKREDGSRWEVREQEAYLWEPGKKLPRSCVIRLEDGERPLHPGDYETDATLVVGDYNRLRVSFDLGLRPVAAKG